MAKLANPGNAYVSATQAAKVAGIPPRTVRYWAERGKVGTRQTADGRMVLLSDVRELAALTRQPATDAAAASPPNGNGNVADPLPGKLPDTLPTVVADPSSAPAIDGNLYMLVAALAARADAADRQAGAAEARTAEERARTDAEKERAVTAEIKLAAAEAEAERLRAEVAALTPAPDQPPPKRRRFLFW